MPFVPTTGSRMIAAIGARSLDHDRVAQVLQRALGLLFRRRREERRAVRVRTPEVHDARDRWLRGPPPRIAGQRDRGVRRAVVAAVHREDLVPSGVQPRHPHRVLVRLCAGVGEEHLVEVTGRDLGDEPGRLAARVVGERRADGAHLRRVVLDGGDQLRVLVADVDVHQLRGEVQVGLAVVVGEVRALRRRDRQRVDQGLRRP